MAFITFEKLGRFGSLGNQMFQLAATLSFAKDLDCPVRIPKNEGYFEETYGRFVDYIDSGLYLGLEYLGPEHKMGYIWREGSWLESTNSPESPILSLEGYFQSERFFKHNAGLIKQKFTAFKPEIQSKISEIATQLPHNKELTAIHVRRGDYLQKQEYHTVLPITYYEAAKKQIGENQHYVVFSDDLSWCKDNFSDDHFFVESGNPFVDLGVMICCDNFIIANSSFSWWGAWLAWSESKKIIAPKQWFGPRNSHLSTKELIPESWIQI